MITVSTAPIFFCFLYFPVFQVKLEYYDPVNENAASFCTSETLLLCVCETPIPGIPHILLEACWAGTEIGGEREKVLGNDEVEARCALFFTRIS